MLLDKYVKGYMPENKDRRPKLTMDYLVQTFDKISDTEKYVGAYPKEPYVVIDVDNHNNDPRNVNAFKRVLSQYKGNYIWWNTSTGVCALFKLPKQLQKNANGDVLLACGIPVEYKSSFNKNGDIGNNKFTIMKNGEVREPHQVGDGVDELPKEFYAIKFNFTNSKGNTLADGQDDSGYNIETYLNNFQMPCMNAGMTDDDISHVIDVINNFVLTKKRNDIDKHKSAIEQQRTKVTITGNKTQEYAHEYVELHQPINIISNSGQTVKDRLGLYAFDGVGYKEIDVDTISQDIYAIHEDFDTVQGDKAWKYVTRDYKHPNANINQFNFNEFTPFLNGVLNTKTGDFIIGGNKPEHKNTLIINCEYNDCYIEDDTSRLVDNFMHTVTCGNMEIEKFLWTWLGLCLAKSTAIDKILFMYGSGENLKSYFMAMVENVFPCINRPIKKLGDDFGCEGVDNGYIMYSTEMYEGNMSETCGDITRQISSQDTVSINGKYQALRQARPICKMMYATNNEVKLGVGKNAKRRTIYVPFSWNRKYNDSVDGKLLEKLGLTIKSMKDWLYSDKRVREYVAYKAVNGLREFLNSKQDLNYNSDDSILPQACIELTQSFLLEHDTVGQWINENDITAEKLDVHNSLYSQKEWYEVYKTWLNSTIEAKDEATKWIELNKKAVKYDTFKERIYSEFNFTPTNRAISIDGVKYRGFMQLQELQ